MAEELEINDLVLGRDIFKLSEIQKEIIYGSLLGDGSIKKNGVFRIGHGEKQINYCKWKQSFFSNLITSQYFNSKGGWNFEIGRCAENNELRRELYGKKERLLTTKFLDKLTPLSIAIWYMDDACLSGSHQKWGYGKIEISVKKYAKDLIDLLAYQLNKEFLVFPTITNRKTLLFSGEESKKIQELVCKYIHPSMQYKLSHHFQDKFEIIWTTFKEPIWKMVKMKILNKEEIIMDSKYMQKFDLEIEDNHNYLVDGVGVHNSPETTTGGNALKFYASQRIDIRRIGQNKDGEEVKSNRTRVKVVKNKVAPPYKKAEFNIEFGTGIDKIQEIIDIAVMLDIIKKSGSWFSYGETKLGQGSAGVKTLFKDNPELCEEIKDKIYKKLEL